MGTNYYHHLRGPCECCGRAWDGAHIGKSSAGWTFSFEGTPQIRSYRDWLEVLKAGGEIRDEYGGIVTLEEFEAMVEQKRDEPRHHAREFHGGNWIDAEGHSFTGGEFS